MLELSVMPLLPSGRRAAGTAAPWLGSAAARSVEPVRALFWHGLPVLISLAFG
jgi:hypothetical protein